MGPDPFQIRLLKKCLPDKEKLFSHSLFCEMKLSCACMQNITIDIQYLNF
jgi:hypothetical protein